MEHKLTVVEDGGEWSALYIDGKLDLVGDSYLIDERIRSFYNVEEIEADFLHGGSHREDCFKTLDELILYKNQEEEKAELLSKLDELSDETMVTVTVNGIEKNVLLGELRGN